MQIKTLRDKEQELLEAVLTKTDWNLEKASRLLQISLSQVKKKSANTACKNRMNRYEHTNPAATTKGGTKG